PLRARHGTPLGRGRCGNAQGDGALRVCSRRPNKGVWNCGLRVPDTFVRPSGTDSKIVWLSPLPRRARGEGAQATRTHPPSAGPVWRAIVTVGPCAAVGTTGK